MEGELLIRGGRIGGRVADVRCALGRIVEVGVNLRRGSPEELDAAGGQLIPGLVDHHLHLRALAAAGSSVQAGPPDVVDAGGLVAALRAAAAARAPGEWIRAVGYHESVAGPLDRSTLDAIVADLPVRVQHRSGSLWVLNSPALAVVEAHSCPLPGVERDDNGRPTGRLWRMDTWLGQRIPQIPGDLSTVSRRAAAAGVTGFTDATPDRSQAETDALVAASEQGVVLQRLCLMTPPGVRIEPSSPSASTRVERGPVKFLLDDVDLPHLDDLVRQLQVARVEGRSVAVHCVTRVQLVVTLAALDVVGPRPGDRIEHGAVIAPGQLATLRRMGLVVVTQPGLVATRGDDYLRDVAGDELPDLWRLASLRRAGVAVALGTDAPYGPADPWVTVRAARDRTTPSGRVVGPHERVALDEAARLMSAPPGRPGFPPTLAPGTPADMCLLHDGVVSHTFVAGQVVFRS